MTILDIFWGVLVFVFWVGVGVGLLYVLALAIDYVDTWLTVRQQERRAEIERALERKQAELRRTVLALADALAEERVAALKTSEQMVARAYLTTGRVP
ncbi:MULTISPECIES: hypothetical protein [Microbacterium]|uniref:hypothetical protein n=1 Tax=Microbacterium TaxID=33882 RepID=UPI00277F2EBD|nr:MULTISPECIES: hypothetical protein [Microbacterium]MDQ1084682.1 hypothetical protein [Microbacterium sp. SORGH_AS_0344]MDQ1170041.1 hypothetical protein [Microbacterium proteolyticum]